MAISFIGKAESSAINGADVTITLPAMQQGDLVIVAGAIGDNDSVATLTMSMVTAGYATVADLFADDTQDVDMGVFWKVMGATPDTTAVFNGQGGTDAGCAAEAMVFRGVDTTTPMDVTPTTATGINTMHPNPPSINHNNPAGVWTVIAGASGHVAGGGATYTFPTGYTTDSDTIGAADTTHVSVGMGYRTNPADPEDPGVMTLSGTDSTGYAWAATTIALRPMSQQQVTGTGSLAVPRPGSAASGLVAFLGSAALAVAISIAGAGAVADPSYTGTGSLAVSQPAISASGTNQQNVTGSGSLAVAQPSLSATGTNQQNVTGSGGLAVSRPSLAGTGAQSNTGTGSLAVGPPALSGSGTNQQNVTASGSLVVPAPTLAGSGNSGDTSITGSGSLAVSNPSLSGAGSQQNTGTGSLAVPVPSLSGSGTNVPPPITGTGAIAVPGPSIAGSETIIGSFTFSIQGGPVMAATLSGGRVLRGSMSGGPV